MCRAEDHGGQWWLCPLMAAVAVLTAFTVVLTVGLPLPTIAPIGLVVFLALAAMKGL